MMMKKFIQITTLLLFIVVTASNADAKNSPYSVSKYTLSEIATGNHNSEVVNKSGMTGKQVRDMLDAYTQEFAGVSLNEFIAKADESLISENHYNTQSFTDGLNVYFDRSPEGHMKKLGSARIKVECCNLVGTDGGLLNNFLRDYAKQSASQSSGYKIDEPKTDDGDKSSEDNSTDNQKNKNEDMTNNNYYAPGLGNPVPPVDGTPWGWIIFGSIIGLIILAIVIIMIMNARNSHLAARQEIMADQAAFSNALWTNIGQFETNKNISNTNAATNARMVAESLSHFNNGQTQQQPNTAG